MTTEPVWMIEARKHIGLAEVPGKGNNMTITNWLVKLNYGWRDDATPWCGTFVAHCMLECGIQPPIIGARARAWLQWGVAILTPVVGAVVVFERKGGGHVGFVCGQDEGGNLMCLGGNQGDRVSIRPFNVSRVIGFRWPREWPVVAVEPLPLVQSDGMVSKQEL